MAVFIIHTVMDFMILSWPIIMDTDMEAMEECMELGIPTYTEITYIMENVRYIIRTTVPEQVEPESCLPQETDEYRYAPMGIVMAT
jgi:uncharacterized protein YchJ